MTLQTFFHEVNQASHGHRRQVSAATVAMVDGTVGIGQQDGHGKIVVELKQVEIQVVDVGDANTDIVFSDRTKGLWWTDNLPVK